MKCSLKQIAQLVGGTIQGDETAELSGIASLQSAGELDLVFVDKEEKLAEALNSRAGALIAGSFCKPGESRKPIILVANPRLAFARAAELLTTAAEYPPGIHASAVIGTNVSLGADVSIESHVFIGDDVVVGKGTRIGAGASIDRGTRIGTKCNIHANVSIYPGVTIGHNVIVHAGATLGSDGFGYVRDETTGRYYKFPQIGRLIIEDDVEIGANSTVDRGALDETRIGQGTKIDNLVHVGHNVTIGKDVVIAAQTGLSGSSTVESDVVIGGQVGIADHVRIESGAILGAQSGIPTRKIIRGKGVVFWGTPARPIRDYLKELAVLAKLARK